MPSNLSDDESSTLMLLFYCARDAAFPEIKRYGLRYSGMGHRLVRDYDAAAKDCPGKLLVIALSGEQLAACKVKEDVVLASSVGLQSFRNLNPFAQVSPVTAAGGIVTRRSESRLEVVMIYRRGVWDLPKGKLDRGETVEDCAKREVMEELGVKSLRVVQPVGYTAHGYREAGAYRVKTTHWYLMQTDATRFRPQADEDIEKVSWMGWNEAVKKAGYETLRELLETVGPTIKRRRAGTV